MKRRIFGVVLLSLLILLTFSAVSAHGHSHTQLEKAGWTCQPIPFGDPADFEFWPHCFPPNISFEGAAAGNYASITVKVFDDLRPDRGNGHFLGTEILIHEDVYNEQPCMGEGGGEYHYLGGPDEPQPIPYYACHHFDPASGLD